MSATKNKPCGCPPENGCVHGKIRAVWRNQYGRPIGDGFGATREEALSKANEQAARTLANANPHWKWCKAKLRYEQW